TEKSVNKTNIAALPILEYNILDTLPHSTKSFTQGLLFNGKEIFESTGSPSEIQDCRSVLGILNLKNGEIDVKAELDRRIYFGEGIAVFKDKIYQLTYKSKTCFIYKLNTFKQINKVSFSNNEGWGLTSNDEELIMSDGSCYLSFLNPDDLSLIKTIPVTKNKEAVNYINELEYVNGFIYANVWLTNDILKIDSKTGNVVARVDLTPLKERALQLYPGSQETNGIAYNPISKSLFVTGKLWPIIYEIKVAGI
ncbi:glutaminyl-peptide cyclotransferase, partial [Flavobacteriales bacterium]|nr:glutaminyl-peptide cyclotransferase [Flavobacteriales bacterium]